MKEMYDLQNQIIKIVCIDTDIILCLCDEISGWNVYFPIYCVE